MYVMRGLNAIVFNIPSYTERYTSQIELIYK